MKGVHFSLLGFLLGVLFFELYHKSTKGSW
jgi:hypothetical protein